MERQELLADAQFAESIRHALAPLLPHGPSLIPLDISVVVASAFHANRILSMKELLAMLPYSATGIRYNLAQLIKRGLIIKEARGEDRRLVHLRPGEELSAAFAKVRSDVINACNQRMR